MSNCLQLQLCQLVISLVVLPKTSNILLYASSVNSAPNERTLKASDESLYSQHPLGEGGGGEEERGDGDEGTRRWPPSRYD